MRVCCVEVRTYAQGSSADFAAAADPNDPIPNCSVAKLRIYFSGTSCPYVAGQYYTLALTAV